MPSDRKRKVCIPKYALNITDEDIIAEETRRKVQAETNIKAKKEKSNVKPKKEKNQPTAAEADDTEPEVVEVSEPQTKRLRAMIPTLQDLSWKLATEKSKAEAPDKDGLVGQRVLEQAADGQTALDEAIQVLGEFEKNGTARKGQVGQAFKDTWTTANAVKATIKKIQFSLEA